MLILQDSRFPLGSLIDYNVLPSEIGLIEDGMALSLVWNTGKSYVQRTTGNGTEQFIGVAYGPRRPLTSAGVIQKDFLIDSTTTPATLTFNDSHTVATVNAAQGILVFKRNSTTGAITAFTPTASPSTAPTGAGTYQLASVNPLQVVFDSADSGTTVSIVFNYIPLLTDVTFDRGNTGYAYNTEQMDSLGKVSVATQSYRLTTDKFLASEDWFTSPSPLKVVAGGYFATGVTSGGTDISGISPQAGRGFARVIEGPQSFSYGTTGVTLSINM